jgi:hypothetical protein
MDPNPNPAATRRSTMSEHEAADLAAQDTPEVTA